jgi:hypothetical protein
MPRAVNWLSCLAVLVISVVACRIPNEEHCGRQLGDATCIDRDPARPYCSVCEAEHDGCVESLAPISAECRPDGSEASAETSGVTTEGPTESEESGTEETETGSSETGPPPECGNGIKEAGEACDGSDFGESTCADPFALPDGMLVCVAGECVIDTSQCCLADGEVCEPGECCNTNCNPITNKCGL